MVEDRAAASQLSGLMHAVIAHLLYLNESYSTEIHYTLFAKYIYSKIVSGSKLRVGPIRVEPHKVVVSGQVAKM